MKKIWIAIFIVLNQLLFAQPLPSSANPNYFPIGVWLQQTRHAKEYKMAGVNTYVGLWDGLDQAQLSELKNAGMKVMCDQNAFALGKLTDTTIYAWTQGDEPDNAQWNATTNKYDPCIDPAVIISRYNDLKVKDATRPVYLNLGQGVSNIDWVGRGTCTGKTDLYPVYKNGYVKGCDIVSYDIYPVNNTDITKEKLWYVPKGIDSLRVWSEDKKPVWCWIEVTKIDSKTSNRQPTAQEVKAEVWMALVHGASGFGYFCHSWKPDLDDAALLNDATMLDAVTKINKEITSLAPVLNSKTTNGYASVTSSNTAVPINMLTKNIGNVNYIFSVGMRPGTTTATFSINSGNTVEVIGEARTITVNAGKFTDNFSSYGVHLYKITGGSTGVQEHEHTKLFSIYPNPANESLTIEWSGSQKKVHYDVMDLAGKKLMSGELDHSAISLSGLAKGAYILVFSNEVILPEIHRFFKE